MNQIKPSEVANLCVYKILPAIAFVAFSIYSFLHVFSAKCSVEHDCFYKLIVGAWFFAVMAGIGLGVIWVVFVVGCFLSDKWNNWLDKMDKESGF